MAIDKQKFTDDLIQIHKWQKQLNKLSENRRADEQALVVEFKVDECNSRRAQIEATYRPQIESLRGQINDLQKNLGEIA